MDIVRYWKDPEYRASMNVDGVPAHPSGLIELDDVTAAAISGGATAEMGSMGCCGGLTSVGDSICVCPSFNCDYSAGGLTVCVCTA